MNPIPLVFLYTDATGTTSYVYNAANQLTQMSAPGKVVTFNYDKNGNQTKRTEGTNITNYTYNPDGKLASITNPDGSTISYTYDGDGRRVSETVAGVTTKYYYDGLLVAEETDANGVVNAQYLYGLGGAPIKMIRGGVSYEYSYNAHGDTLLLTDSTGAVKATYSYDPWGLVTILTGSTIKNPFMYAGQFGVYHNSSTGFDLMQSRYYNSGISRFMSMDEFPGIVAQPISHNAYAYVHDDPINNVDPDGHWPQWLNNAWNSVTNFVSNTASAVANTVESAASWAYNEVKSAVNWVANEAEAGYNYVSSKVSDAYHKAKSAVSSAYNQVASYSRSAAAKARAVAQKAAEIAAAAKRQAEVKLAKMKADAKAAFEETTGNIKENAQKAYQAFKSSTAGNFALGMADAGVGAIKGIVNLVQHPIQTVSAIGNAIAHPIVTGKAIWNGISDAYNEQVVNGDSNSRARFWGRAVGEVGLALVGTKGLDKVADLAKAGEIGNQLGRVGSFAKELGANYLDELQSPVMGITAKGPLQRALENTLDTRNAVYEGAGKGKYDGFRNFDDHYDIHVRGDKTKRPNANREYGDDFTKDDYYNNAFDLATSKVDMDDIFNKSLSDGREAIYRKSTNDLVMTQNGEVTTFFKPKFSSNDPYAGYKYFSNMK